MRHLFDNFAIRVPRALITDEAAVELLVGHRFFQPGITPVQFFNRATDPMLPPVKPHTFRVLELLDGRGLTNHVLVITRWRVTDEDCERLNALTSIRLTVLVTHSGIDDPRIEPVDSQIAATSLQTLYRYAKPEGYRVVLYRRPIVPGLNDTDAHLARARQLSASAHATVFTGLFYRDQIKQYYQDLKLPEPYPDTARRKVFPELLEQRILAAFADLPGRLFRKTSCGVTAAHQVADYNGHFSVAEICDICPAAQVARCAAAHRRPDPARLTELAMALGALQPPEITDRAVITTGLDEQRRYFLQHTFGYQIHDRDKPHHPRRHGRADIHWPAPPQPQPAPLTQP